MVNPYAWLFLSVLSIFSVLFGIYTWIKSQSRKEFSYSFVSHSIVRGGKKLDPAIKFTFNDIELNNLTSTRFAIWNSGNQVINYDDIVREKELTIVVADDAEILSVEIVGESDATNKFRLSDMTVRSQSLCFDYVDKREGIVLQIFHTGYKEDLSLRCKIKGGKPVRNTNKSVPIRRRFLKLDPQKVTAIWAAIMSGYLTILSPVLIAAAWIPEIYHKIYSIDTITPTSRIITTIVLILVTTFCDFSSLKILKHAFQFSVPYKLRKYM